MNPGPLVVKLFVGLYSHFVVNPPQTVLMGFMVNSGPLVMNLFVGLYSHFVVNPPQTVLMGFYGEFRPVSSEPVCGTL